nr:uncharacterized protein LOC112029827 [Quercus suber]POF25346.1 hypothetical protein CFP56_32589 [Quercus suber]
MESEDLDDTSIKRNSYRSSRKRKSKSTSDEVINYNNNDTIITNPTDPLVITSNKKGIRKGPKRKKYWYGTLSDEQKRDLCKKRREVYAQKKALAKEAITNNQCVSGQQKRAEYRSSYSAFSKERETEICKIRDEVDAQRIALAKEAIKNA